MGACALLITVYKNWHPPLRSFHKSVVLVYMKKAKVKGVTFAGWRSASLLKRTQQLFRKVFTFLENNHSSRNFQRGRT